MSTTSGATSGPQPLDAGVDVAPSDDCGSATEGATCPREGEICRGACSDPCSLCGFLACSQGRWEPGEDSPAGSCAPDAGRDAPVDAGPSPSRFPCGPAKPDGGTLLCLYPDELCEESGGGPPPLPDAGPSVGYACKTVPPACDAEPTCTCLLANDTFCAGGGGQVVACAADGGAAMVTCAYP